MLEGDLKAAVTNLGPASPVRILLVDDDEVDREAVSRLLASPYEVVEAATGRAALECLQTGLPDCVLLDYLLPDLDALVLLAKCVEAYVPVVVLTGEDSPEVIVTTLQRGAQDYLVKNQLSKHGLESAIANAVEKVALRRDLDAKQRLLREQALALEAKNRQLRRLASDLTLAEQRERHRIAHILHDDFQQRLYGVRLLLRALQRDLREQGEVVTNLEEAYRQLGAVVQASRQLTVDLSPPVLKGEGLHEALGWLASQMAERFELEVRLEKKTDVPLPSEAMRVLLFQVVRELLTNVANHAVTSWARVTLQAADGLISIVVEDEGQGFDPDTLTEETQEGFGLYAVREKLALFGGTFALSSAPGHGTRALIAIPIASL